jgi:hypothetical protein
LEKKNFPYCDIGIDGNQLILNEYYFNGQSAALQDAMVGYTRGSIYQNQFTRALFLIETLTTTSNYADHVSVFQCLKFLLQHDVVTVFKKRMNASPIRATIKLRLCEISPSKFFSYVQALVVKTGVMFIQCRI